MNPVQALAERAAQAAAEGSFVPGSTQAPPSPCIGVCRMSASGSHCEGCFRTLDDIRDWSVAGPDARRAVWSALLRRAGLAVPAPLSGIAMERTSP
ncbi:protein of unknown function DUF1289 [Paracidovorax avenae ATCC 19860]|uniref:DUF1289 domain-containing protein n=1 Tax=Paracidovorax avenae (strain ATCC 19860 / DSM 7227 / CCUG 15838 / JCM 20985 / LMG 2117 / NCPPB 1011) TaxID=643561 RepID=F0Q6S3_PARA1|nr:DUF1289 domain-containing protein [Paracidovorax avenae]ADX48131.1 protein of unknown function DUF1289 [Paracidovorax avenae ATCC 19860]AVS65767.1 DUF1289 domain-containing protein [Paracidovorax avenae]